MANEIKLQIKVNTDAVDILLQSLNVVHLLNELDPTADYPPEIAKIIKIARTVIAQNKGKTVSMMID